MYSPPELEWSNPFLDRIMVFEPPKRAGQLLQTLLFNLLSRLPPPGSNAALSSSITTVNGNDDNTDDARTVAANGDRPHGLLRRIRTGLVTVIKLPVVISVSIFRYLFPVKQPSNWLADRSSMLFLILCHQGIRLPDPELDLDDDDDDDDDDDAVVSADHPSTTTSASSDAPSTSSSGSGRRERLQSVESQGTAELRDLYSRNIFRVVLSQLVDDQIDTDTPTNSSSVTEAQALRLPFDRLYEALGSALPSEWSTLVLYSLLHGNTSFREFVFAKSDLDVLVRVCFLLGVRLQ
jgi:hypothetical protein